MDMPEIEEICLDDFSSDEWTSDSDEDFQMFYLKLMKKNLEIAYNFLGQDFLFLCYVNQFLTSSLE